MSAPAEQRGGFGRGAARGGDRGRGGAYRMRLEEGRNGTGEQVYRSRQQRRRTGPNTSWIRIINRKDGMLDMRERSISQHGRRRIRWRPEELKTGREGDHMLCGLWTCCRQSEFGSDDTSEKAGRITISPTPARHPPTGSSSPAA